jgi:hypothetical protein
MTHELAVGSALTTGHPPAARVAVAAYWAHVVELDKYRTFSHYYIVPRAQRLGVASMFRAYGQLRLFGASRLFPLLSSHVLETWHNRKERRALLSLANLHGEQGKHADALS